MVKAHLFASSTPPWDLPRWRTGPARRSQRFRATTAQHRGYRDASEPISVPGNSGRPFRWMVFSCDLDPAMRTKPTIMEISCLTWVGCWKIAFHWTSAIFRVYVNILETGGRPNITWTSWGYHWDIQWDTRFNWDIDHNLVGGFNPSEKYEIQLGWWHSQYMEK